MPIGQFSTSNYLLAAQGDTPRYEYPLSLSAWMYFVSEPTGTQVLFDIHNPGSAVNTNSLRISFATFNVIDVYSYDSGGTGSRATATAYVVGQWFHVGGVWGAANHRALYYNGSFQDDNTTSRTVDFTTHEMWVGCRNGAGAGTPITAYVAHMGIWGAKLTDHEMKLLGKGALPTQIRRHSLAAYYPFNEGGGDVRNNVGPKGKLTRPSALATVTGPANPRLGSRIFVPLSFISSPIITQQPPAESGFVPSAPLWIHPF